MIRPTFVLVFEFQIQVVVSNREMAQKRRQAFIFFIAADDDSVIEPLDGSSVHPPTSIKDLSQDIAAAYTKYEIAP